MALPHTSLNALSDQLLLLSLNQLSPLTGNGQTALAVRTVTVQVQVTDEQAEALSRLALDNIGFMSACERGDVEATVGHIVDALPTKLVALLNRAFLCLEDPLPDFYANVLGMVVENSQCQGAKEIIISWIEKAYARAQSDKVLQACCKLRFTAEEPYFSRLNRIFLQLAFLDRGAPSLCQLVTALRQSNIDTAEQSLVVLNGRKSQTLQRLLSIALETNESASLFATALELLCRCNRGALEPKEIKALLAKAYNNRNVSDLLIGKTLHVNRRVVALVSATLAQSLTADKLTDEQKQALLFIYKGDIPDLETLEKLYELLSDDLWLKTLQSAIVKAFTLCTQDSFIATIKRFGRHLTSLDLATVIVEEERFLKLFGHHFVNVKTLYLSPKSTKRSLTGIEKLRKLESLAVRSPESSDCNEIALSDIPHIPLKELHLEHPHIALQLMQQGTLGNTGSDMLTSLRALTLTLPVTQSKQMQGSWTTCFASTCRLLPNLESLVLQGPFDAAFLDVIKFGNLKTLKLSLKQPLEDCAPLLEKLVYLSRRSRQLKTVEINFTAKEMPADEQVGACLRATPITTLVLNGKSYQDVAST